MAIEQMQLADSDSTLGSVFILPKNHTLKISPRASKTLTNCIYAASQYLKLNSHGVNRIEFPFEGQYFVVANLKDTPND